MTDDWVLHKELVLHLLKSLEKEIQELKDKTKTLDLDVQQLKIIENRLEDLVKIAKDLNTLRAELQQIEKSVLVMRTRWAFIGIIGGTILTAAVNYGFRLIG